MAKFRSTLVLGSTGCFLFMIMLFNFIFGWMFLNFTTWVSVGAVLVLLCIVAAFITTKKASSVFFGSKSGKVIDVEGYVVEDKKRLE